jgi:hypothetical protein
MAYQFFGRNVPKNIEYLNVDVFLPFVSKITNGFTITPESSFRKWAALKRVDVAAPYESLKASVEELSNVAPLPLEVSQYFTDATTDLSTGQRFDLFLSLRAFDNLLNPDLNFVDPAGYKWHEEYFEAFENGERDMKTLEGMTKLFSRFYEEVNNLKIALDTLTPRKDAIIKVFSNQNIRYATGLLNIDKIHKVLKSQFGDDWNGYAAYKGVLIGHFLASHTNADLLKPSSSFVGLSLEKAVFELYRLVGYAVSETSTSGDFGIDIIAQSNVEKIGIQCKNYTGNVGVEAVMQAHSGGHYYGCTRFIVYGTSGFTSAALEMATKLNVELLIYKGTLLSA